MNSSSKKTPLDLIPIGKILKPRGLKGELKVFLYNEDSESLNSNLNIWININDSFKSFKLIYISSCKNNRIINIEGIDSRELSEDLKNKKIYISRKDFPDSKDFYLIDIRYL